MRKASCSLGRLRCSMTEKHAPRIASDTIEAPPSLPPPTRPRQRFRAAPYRRPNRPFSAACLRCIPPVAVALRALSMVLPLPALVAMVAQVAALVATAARVVAPAANPGLLPAPAAMPGPLAARVAAPAANPGPLAALAAMPGLLAARVASAAATVGESVERPRCVLGPQRQPRSVRRSFDAVPVARSRPLTTRASRRVVHCTKCRSCCLGPVAGAAAHRTAARRDRWRLARQRERHRQIPAQSLRGPVTA